MRPATNDLFWAGVTCMAFLPSTVAPAGATRNGLPIGVQIVGKWYDDRSTIAFAQILERDFRAFVPPPGY
jgi:amidase